MSAENVITLLYTGLVENCKFYISILQCLLFCMCLYDNNNDDGDVFSTSMSWMTKASVCCWVRARTVPSTQPVIVTPRCALL